jgi:hypothetical protein
MGFCHFSPFSLVLVTNDEIMISVTGFLPFLVQTDFGEESVASYLAFGEKGFWEVVMILQSLEAEA